LKRVLDDLDPRFLTFEQQHFHNVESKQDIRVIEHSQPGQTTTRDPLLLPPIHRRDRPAKILARSRFHFDKDKCVPIAANNVDLAARAPAKVPVENLVSVTPQMAAR
jgi:hypothetical protein